MVICIDTSMSTLKSHYLTPRKKMENISEQIYTTNFIRENNVANLVWPNQYVKHYYLLSKKKKKKKKI